MPHITFYDLREQTDVWRCPSIVRHQLGAVAGAARFDAALFLRRQMRMVNLHRGDHIMDGAFLERGDGGCPGMTGMTVLRIAPPEFQRAPFLEPEGDAAVSH